jgi:hypothetical protein
MPSKRKLNDLQKMLDDYAIGTMNFSRSRVCLPANAGGIFDGTAGYLDYQGKSINQGRLAL